MKILLPIEDSENSLKTIQWACDFFKTNNKAELEIYLLHVIPLYIFHDDMMRPLVQNYENKESFRILEEAKHQLGLCGYQVQDAYYVIGDAAAEICKYADEKGIEHILMGSHGRTGLGKVLMGSVSEEVFKKAKQSVIVLNNNNKKLSLTVNHIDEIHIAESV